MELHNILKYLDHLEKFIYVKCINIHIYDRRMYYMYIITDIAYIIFYLSFTCICTLSADKSPLWTNKEKRNSKKV